MITNFVLKTSPLALFMLGIADKDVVRHHSLAKLMRRVAEMCEEKWWDTNNLDNPPDEGNDCFYVDVNDTISGEKFYAEAVPYERPYVYLWIREVKETRIIDELTLEFNHPDETVLMEKMPEDPPQPSLPRDGQHRTGIAH